MLLTSISQVNMPVLGTVLTPQSLSSEVAGITSQEIPRKHLVHLFTVEIASLPARPLQQYIWQVLSHCHGDLTVEKVAKTIGVTRQHLARLCRLTRLRHEPHWYLSVARLLAAASLLDEDGTCVSHIATDLRFGEASDLYAMFERYSGRTLRELRRDGVWTHMELLYRRALTPTPNSLPISSSMSGWPSKGSNEVIKGSI